LDRATVPGVNPRKDVVPLLRKVSALHTTTERTNQTLFRLLRTPSYTLTLASQLVPRPTRASGCCARRQSSRRCPSKRLSGS
jgi:hypothetical protein